jgi:hypothetical protein
MRRARELADQLATELLRRATTVVEHSERAPDLRAAPAEPAVPVNITAIATALGASTREVEMAQDGLLVEDGETATIFVRASAPNVRRRFTIAHELAHWALRSPALSGAVVSETREAFRSEEILCDTVAGALLMPQAWMRRSFGTRARMSDSPLVVLDDAARTAQVSLAAATVRFRDVFRWRRALLQWKCENGRWEFYDEAGLMPWELGQIWPSADVSMFLWAAAASPGEVRCGRLPLCIGGAEVDACVELVGNRDSVAVLVALPPEKRRLAA